MISSQICQSKTVDLMYNDSLSDTNPKANVSYSYTILRLVPDQDGCSVAMYLFILVANLNVGFHGNQFSIRITSSGGSMSIQVKHQNLGESSEIVSMVIKFPSL